MFGWSVYPAVVNLARRPNIAVSQSTTCWSGPASRAVDGNTNGLWAGNSVTHTCEGEPAWWRIDLGSDQYVVTGVKVFNRVDSCCMDRNYNSQVQVLDAGMNVLAYDTIAIGDTSAVYSFTFDNIEGAKFVQVQKNQNGSLQLAEVQVFGWALESSTSVPSHYTSDGCIGNGIYHDNKVLSDTSSATVSCCNGSVDDGSLTCSRSGCANVDFNGAKGHCEGMGLRLCSVAELNSGPCCGTGCGFDNDLGWASDAAF